MPFSSKRRWSALQFGDDDVRARRARALPAGRAADDRRAGGARRPARRRVRRRARPGRRGRRPRRSTSRSGSSCSASACAPTRARRSSSCSRRACACSSSPATGRRRSRPSPPMSESRAPRSTGATCRAIPPALRRLLEEHAVIGRISPEDKKRVVEALAADGRYVAMVGDGVNDVPALKAARLAIAPGNGSQMARAVADLVLVRGDFASVPALVAEGRKVLRNLQRVAKLFVAKSAFAFFLVVSIGLTPQPYPLLPRHLTLAAGLTIGIPAFFLALGPSEGRFRSERFLFDVGRFAVPAGTAAGLGVLASFVFARNVGRLPLERGADDRDDRPRARRPLPDPRARGDEPQTGRGGRDAHRGDAAALRDRPRRARHAALLRADASRARAGSSSRSPAPRSRSAGCGSPTTGSCRGRFAPSSVGLRLRPVAAHGHLAPHGRPVARAVVEEPVADVAPARLQPRPRAVGHRGVDDPDEIGERAVDVAARRLEHAVLGRRCARRAPLRAPASVRRRRCSRARARGAFAKLERALEVRLRDARSGVEQPELDEAPPGAAPASGAPRVRARGRRCSRSAARARAARAQARRRCM